jgi:hypothetical protein
MGEGLAAREALAVEVAVYGPVQLPPLWSPWLNVIQFRVDLACSASGPRPGGGWRHLLSDRA